MADIIFTLKIVVVLLIVCGLVLGIAAIVLFTGDKSVLPPKMKLAIGALLALIDLVLLAVGYAAFFMKVH